PSSTPFPYTTLFRSENIQDHFRTIINEPEQCLLPVEHDQRRAVLQDDFLTFLQGFRCTGMSQNLPLTQKALDQNFNPATGFFLAKQASRNHSGIVEDQKVARLKQIRKIGELKMLGLTGQAIKAEQTGGTALFERVSGDQLVRQVKM